MLPDDFLRCRHCRRKAEYFMVKDGIWKKTRLKNGILCVKCLEGLIGRQLIGEDFTDCIANVDALYSKAPSAALSAAMDGWKPSRRTVLKWALMELDMFVQVLEGDD